MKSAPLSSIGKDVTGRTLTGPVCGRRRVPFQGDSDGPTCVHKTNLAN